MNAWVEIASAAARLMKRKRSRGQIIYEVALGGIAAAMALLFVWLSVVVRYGTISFYVAACLALLVPMSQRYYFASISAYVVSSLLAFAIVGDIFAISGYVVYFAPICLLSCFMLEKKVKWYVSTPIKAVYIAGALAFLYYVAGTIMINPKLLGEVPFWAVELVGIVALLAIDVLVMYVYGVLKTRVSKVLRKRFKIADQEVKDEDDVEDFNPFDTGDDSVFEDNSKQFESTDSEPVDEE